MNDPTAWVIALLFYAPFHFLGPAGLVLLAGQESTTDRRRLLRAILIDCTVTMLIAFGIAIVLFAYQPQLSMAILVLSMLTPYLHVLIKRIKKPAQQ